jgi:hypothetical protein
MREGSKYSAAIGSAEEEGTRASNYRRLLSRSIPRLGAALEHGWQAAALWGPRKQCPDKRAGDADLVSPALQRGERYANRVGSSVGTVQGRFYAGTESPGIQTPQNPQGSPSGGFARDQPATAQPALVIRRQKFFERLPIVALPTPIQVIVFACRKTGVIEGQGGAGSVRPEFKMNDRVDPRIPMRRPPRLDNPLVLDQLHVAPHDEPAKQGESSAGHGVNAGREPGERGELLRVEKRAVNALRSSSEIEIVVDGGARRVRGSGRPLFHRRLLCVSPQIPKSAARCNRDCGGSLAAVD